MEEKLAITIYDEKVTEAIRILRESGVNIWSLMFDAILNAAEDEQAA